MIRCAIYTRQSVVRPNDTDFTSCDAQREACPELVRARAPDGWTALDERFNDVGESGATIERPALTRRLARVAAGGVDRVVVHRLHRLTRSVSDWTNLVGTFKRRGTALTILVGDIHLGDLAMSDLMLNVLGTFAEFEREIIGERLRDAPAALRRRGIRNAGRDLSLPFNASRCSEDRLRPFVRSTAPWLRRTPGWTHVFRVALQTPGGGGPRRTARTGRPAISAWPVHPQAGRILRRLARVAMMEAADHGCLDESAFVTEMASVQPAHRRDSRTQNSRSAVRSRGRGAVRWRMPSW